mgnify:CR=1 FL=1
MLKNISRMSEARMHFILYPAAMKYRLCILLYCFILYCNVSSCFALCFIIVLYCNALFCTVLHYFAMHCIVFHGTVLLYYYYTELQCIVMVLHCSVLLLYCTAMHCIVLNCTVLLFATILYSNALLRLVFLCVFRQGYVS